jgi:hypothetical protein
MSPHPEKGLELEKQRVFGNAAKGICLGMKL